MMMRWLAALLCCLAMLPVSAATPARPNFILILLDDLGWQDVGFMGNDLVETPAMDQLAAQGMVFTRAYANAPNCAPSRAAIMSGQYAPRTGVYTMISGDMGNARARKLQTPHNLMYLPEQVYTLAELLHDHGYATANIGKWNLGNGPLRGPLGQGFDVNVGGYRGGSPKTGYFAPYDKELPGLQEAPAGEYLTDRLNAEAVRFVREHAQQPFFLYLPHFAPHFPVQAPAQTVKKYAEKKARLCNGKTPLRHCDMDETYAAMIEHVDRGITALIDTLRQQNTLDNTVIVLLSDNGPEEHYSWHSPLRGGKSSLYENGIRVPMLWFGHQRVKAAARSDVAVAGTDIYPTFAAMAGIDVGAQVLDGRDLSAVLAGKAEALSGRALFWYFPGYVSAADAGEHEQSAAQASDARQAFFQLPAAVIQQDDWKLIRYYDGTAPELFNLAQDEQEQHNLFVREPAQAKALLHTLEQWLKQTGAALTLPANPQFEQEKKRD